MFKWEKRDSNAPTERADFIICWIKDLIDLKAKQTEECLHDKKGFCCLGIASNIAGYKWIWDENDSKYVIRVNRYDYESYLPGELAVFLGTRSTNVEFTTSITIPNYGRFRSLVAMNDEGLSFRIIAKTIQSECTNLFKALTSEEETYIKAYKIPTRQELRNLRKAAD